MFSYQVALSREIKIFYQLREAVSMGVGPGWFCLQTFETLKWSLGYRRVLNFEFKFSSTL